MKVINLYWLWMQTDFKLSSRARCGVKSILADHPYMGTAGMI